MTDPKYQKGKIYKIVNSVDSEYYVGSTIKTLKDRFCLHIGATLDESKKSKIVKHIRKIGYQYFNILLIEDYPCNTKDELLMRERYYYETLKPSLNVLCPIRTLADMGSSYTIKKEIKLTCQCGSTIIAFQEKQHLKTKKHTDFDLAKTGGEII